jgi:propionyl-CoA synthetase
VARHPMVAECAVFGVPDEFRGEIPVALVVFKVFLPRVSEKVKK